MCVIHSFCFFSFWVYHTVSHRIPSHPVASHHAKMPNIDISSSNMVLLPWCLLVIIGFFLRSAYTSFAPYYLPPYVNWYLQRLFQHETTSPLPGWHYPINQISLTHSGQDKIAIIVQMTFSKPFSWMKTFEFSVPSHYLNQWWTSSLTLIWVTRA